MIKKYLDKIRTMDKQALTAFGTCGLFFLLALVQLLILAFSSFGRSWDHILLLLVDVVIGAIACYMGFRWQNKQSRPAAAPQQAPKARPAQPSPKTRPTQQLQKARPAQPSSMENVPNAPESQPLSMPSVNTAPQSNPFDDTDWDDEF